MTNRGPSVLGRVSGLVIQADAPVTGLRPLDVFEPPDVCVRMRGTIGQPPAHETSGAWYVSPYRDERGIPLLTIRTAGTGYLLCYAEGTCFLVSASGREVDAWWEEPLTDVDTADYLLGGVLAFIARLRGRVPVHASAVVIQDQAILFAGAAGAGKSSIASAFAVLGYPVLSDDVVVIDDSNVGGVVAHPSRARLSLWPDSAASLFSTQSLPAHSPVYAKRRLDLVEHGYRFHERPVQVGTICVLADRGASSLGPTIRALRPQAALMNLVSHTYGNYLLDASMRAREFDVLGRIAASVHVSELSLGASLDELVSDCRSLADRLALQSAAQAT
jgi:hypothetical protein